MVERSLSMREVAGSMPAFSITFFSVEPVSIRYFVFGGRRPTVTPLQKDIVFFHHHTFLMRNITMPDLLEDIYLLFSGSFCLFINISLKTLKTHNW